MVTFSTCSNRTRDIIWISALLIFKFNIYEKDYHKLRQRIILADEDILLFHLLRISEGFLFYDLEPIIFPSFLYCQKENKLAAVQKGG